MTKWKENKEKPEIGSKIEYITRSKKQGITVWAYIDGVPGPINEVPWDSVLFWSYIDKNYADDVGLDKGYVITENGPVYVTYSKAPRGGETLKEENDG